MSIQFSAAQAQLIASSVNSYIRGKANCVELALVCLVAQGHLLLDDVPGVGKTSLARSLAAALGVGWQRIQFTPDLLPSDITGVSVYHQESARFEFHPGPVFTAVLLADELNRASPRTQSALLEAMEERTVSVDGRAHMLPSPFLVIATQNPVEQAGTYPLPEAQLDRFLMRTSLGYPDKQAEIEVLWGHHRGTRVDDHAPVLNPESLAELIAAAGRVNVEPAIVDYIVRISAETRATEGLALGASPRGSIGLLRASKALALVRGRDHVIPGDVQELAVPVLAHRLILNADALGRGLSAEDIVRRVIDVVPAPQPE